MPYTTKTWSETWADLEITFEKWGVDEWKVDAGLRGARAAKAYQTPVERRVSLTYTKDGADVELTIDKWPRSVDNLRALYLTVESLRLNEYRGIADAVRQAYAQLPPPVDTPAPRDPYEVFGVLRGTSLVVIEAIYKELVKRMHPDAGGDPQQWHELQAAIEAIRRELKA